MEKYTFDNESLKRLFKKTEVFDTGLEYDTLIEETIEQIEEVIEREEKKRIDKINKFVYTFIKSHYSPFDIKYAFSSYDSFCEFIERIENDIREDGRIYKL